MTDVDDLLTWCSERRSGSIAALRDATRWVSKVMPQWRSDLDIIADLDSLGHLEVDWMNGRWSVAPTTLCLIPDAGGIGFLSGGRTHDLEAALCDAVSFGSAEHRLFVHDPVPQNGPSSWFMNTDRSVEAEEALRKLGIDIVVDPSGSLLELLKRSIASSRHGVRREVRPGELPTRLEIDPSTLALGWVATENDSAPGGYGYLRNGRRVFGLRSDDGWFEAERAWVVWACLPCSVPHLWHIPRERQLFVRVGVRLPTLLARTLVLRTGRLPVRIEAPAELGVSEPVLRFENISSSVAESTATILGHEVTYT